MGCVGYSSLELLNYIVFIEMICAMQLFNMLKHFHHIIVFFSNKIWVFKWVLGQESHPYGLCLEVTFQGQL